MNNLKIHFLCLELTTVAETWAESYTKLLAFNQTDYDRVLSLDSDSTVLQVLSPNYYLSIYANLPSAYG